jgi:hypothetical protein
MNVQELLDVLEGFEPESQVMLAFQPSWPMQYHLGELVEVSGECNVDEDGRCETHGDQFESTEAVEAHLSSKAGSLTVYLGEGGQPWDAPYLPSETIAALGWR